MKENSHLRTIVNQDGAAVLDTKLGSISTLNATGAYVWQRLERGESVETIVADLSRETGEQPEIVEPDVRDSLKACVHSSCCPIDSAKEPQW